MDLEDVDIGCSWGIILLIKVSLISQMSKIV